MSRADIRLLGLFLGISLAFGISPAAQTPRPMTLVSLAEVPRLLDPQLSPDGRTVVYTLMQADWKANRQVGQIWRQELGSGPPTQITHTDAGATSARWAPGGSSILYLAPRGQGLQIHLLPMPGGEPRALTSHATSVSQPAWAADGAVIYFLAPDARNPEEREKERLRDDVFAFDENFTHRHLWKVSVETGVEERVTNGPFSVLSYRLSRDGRFIVLHRAPSPRPDDSSLSEIWLVDANGGNARQLTRNSIEEVEAEISPDNRRVLFLAEANERLEPYYSSALFVMPVDGGTPRKVAPDFRHAVERAAWAPDGESMLTVVNMGLHSEIVRFSQTRDGVTATALTDGRHSVQFWSVSHAAGRMIFQLDEPTRLGDAWTLAPNEAAPTRVTGVYDRFASDFRLPRQERVEWRGADGVMIEGILFHPVDSEEGRRYPLVVQLHGGPSESDKFGYGPGVIVNYVPVLAARGYAVFRPNYRGSSGYGDTFLRDVIGGYFTNMHLDVLAGVDALVDRGVADPEQLAVMGWSAGAHLTNRLITITDRFKAAASTSGAANWVSFFAETDVRGHRELWFGGTPWQASASIDAFWAQSPLSGAAKVRTPTLFLVGENDPRVPVGQSIEMYRALRANGVPTRLLVAPREGHQWTELRHQLYKANAELEWFERHVRGRPYAWESAPGSG